MILLAVLMMIVLSRLPGRKPVIFYPKSGDSGITPLSVEKSLEEKKAARNSRRKLRKKLR
ncbi:MAG: hypothetical protein LBC27_02850 [Spirochaetaceae bacterium]|jgi:hypothetical protein|nr:hypothetical protein [Spirochaetaceae bacterium]